MNNKAYKFRIYPTEEQATLIAKTFGCVRLIYNGILKEKNLYYKEHKKSTFPTPAKYKKILELEFLKEVDCQALCNSQLDLQQAFSNFFDSLSGKRKGRKMGFPKEKTLKKSKKTYTTNCINNSIRIEDGKLRLPKLGLVKTVFHRKVEGKIKAATISQTKTGKYFVSILTEQEKKETNHVVNENNRVGIDMSLNNFIITSDGEKANHPKWFRTNQRKLKKAQRKLRKKPYGSNGRAKQNLKVARIYEKQANQRRDFCYKLAAKISDKFDVAVVEDINLQNMARTLKLGKSIGDLGFSIFRTMLENKMKEKGKTFIKADKWFPSSKLCSNCGVKNNELKLGEMDWTCYNCDMTHDRDINAAQNLKNYNTVATTGIYAGGDKTSTFSSSRKSKSSRGNQKNCETTHKPPALAGGS